MTSYLTAPGPDSVTAERARVQRRTLPLLFGTQIVGGIGTTIAVSVGALLTSRLVGTGLSGLAQSAAVVGAALLAVPVTAVMNRRGRRPGLALAYLVGAAGAALVVAATVTRWVPLLFLGMLLLGGGTTANLQARYAAVDLAEPARRGRQLSLIVWATTLGAVAAPPLAPLADTALHRFGLPPLAGPFAFSAVAFVVAAGALQLFLRPDPLLTARRAAALTAPVAAAPHGLTAAVRAVAGRPAARLGVAAVAVGHLVMVGVMAMTPVHLDQRHGGDVLRVVGIVLSLHIAGMYALAPLVGWLTDRLGRRAVILGGVGLLLAACGVAGTAGHDVTRISVGLVLLGLGWSATMVAGSTLLSESVPVGLRPAVQGLSDLTMGLAGAAAGALSGFIVLWAGYSVLNLLAAIATVPLLALALPPLSVTSRPPAAKPPTTAGDRGVEKCG
ncbi:Predicted arabinose efflux permease, MFS family [Micromonospora pattaloongensis]|uniref:Predicted arabinose efflux permease, MFS family n=1 Tax=Micromonospora pattaloongensis TaxID=405436 RepID=A0A1H3KE82_9ACTN|nr:MFS transporter [Micromonospora pattaloongensis]SDY50386.1 Predicted arabinose efflux permease, MFS family [Micromonospora pattaloongensis]